ncbi:Protein lin-28 like protein A [Myotis davidii]|uniref:Protein lin-28 like protein A n=1 Tax=Myotis davidii TaxID=225400 RepID=L5MB22_MYODS|nr:Protein lin-28 like protein A [Myotis davidii]
MSAPVLCCDTHLPQTGAPAGNQSSGSQFPCELPLPLPPDHDSLYESDLRSWLMWLSWLSIDPGTERASTRSGARATGSADYHGSVTNQQFAGGCAKAPEAAQEDEARTVEEPQLLQGAGICKWFNVCVGFGFLSMTARAGVAFDPPVDVFVHQSKLYMGDFRSLEGEAVEFTFKKSAKDLESIRVTGPGGVFCIWE